MYNRAIKILVWGIVMFFYGDVFAQQIALPHGMIYGTKPDTSQALPAAKLETTMGHKARISTTIKGKVIKVTKQKGGWFLLDAGKGKTIEAHFKDYAVTIPAQLSGKTVIIQGVAAKQFKADPSQHYAGDSVVKKRPVAPKKKTVIDFEVVGLMVDK